jgi:hypothetical protein
MNVVFHDDHGRPTADDVQLENNELQGAMLDAA